MLFFRKTDRALQLMMAILALASLPFFYPHGAFAALCLPGCWQLISASLNTPAFLRHGRRVQIVCYWIFAVLSLFLTFIPFYSGSISFFHTGDIAFAGFCLSFITIVYYLVIYKRLLDFMHIRRELQGLTGSGH